MKGFWLEFRNLPHWTGGRGSQVNQVLLILLAGLFLPFRMGIEFLDPLTIVPYSLTGLVFVTGAAPEAFAGREACTRPGPRIWSLALGGSLYFLLILLSGFAVVNIGFWHGEVLITPLPVCLAAVLLSFTLAALTAAWSARLLELRHTPSEIKTRLRLGLLMVLALWTFQTSLVPVALREWVAPYATTWGLTGISVAISLVAWLLTRARIRSIQIGGADAMVG